MKFNKILEMSELFDSTLFGLIILDSNFDFLLINDSAKKSFNYSEDLKAKIFSYFSIRSSERLQQTLSNIKITSGNQSIVLEPINSEKYLECEISCSNFEKEEVYILFIKDVSQKYRLQEIIEAQHQEQQKTTNELEKEQEFSDLKSRFIAIASHEFKTPLTGILSSLKLLERYIKYDEDAWSQHFYKDKIDSHFYKISSAIENLNQILDQFLSLSRIQSKSFDFHKELINVRSLMYDIINQLNTLTKENQIIYLNYSGQEELEIDQMILRIIVSNIITNSIKYSQENSQIHVKINNYEGILEIEIRDQGIGIPESEQKDVFKRFYRASNAENIQGTGLGLHIIKKYIELLNGSISFESKENEGTVFTILIPIENE